MPEQEVINGDFSPELAITSPANCSIKRPDSLSSLVSLNSLSSTNSASSKNVHSRQMSVTSLTSLSAVELECEVGDGVSSVITPDSDAGIEIQLHMKTASADESSCEKAASGHQNIDHSWVSDDSKSTQQLRKEHNSRKDTEQAEATENQCKQIMSKKEQQHRPEAMEKAPEEVQRYINLSLKLLSIVGTVNENLFFTASGNETNRVGYAPLYSTKDFGGFHYRNIFRRWQDCFCNPINSAATNMISLMERKFESSYSSRYTLTGESRWYINLGSYNYLGFGGVGPCSTEAEKAMEKYGICSASVRQEAGTQRVHVELEQLVAEFLGVEAAITFGMGFATNSMNLPGLLDSNCLVLSDRMNHASIILGMRLSGATIRVFEHNNMPDLERQLIRAVTDNKRYWHKILIVVEGVYSMEGSLVQLPEVIRLKKRYGAYLYLDEAHSIGAVGPTGRGVIEYFGCQPEDVDVLMGTFTKSFGAAGGYIGGSQKLINHLRVHSQSAAYACAMPAAVCQQVITSMRMIMGRDGTDTGRVKISTLARNAVYFRRRLRQLGFIVYGDDNSPVVPLLSFFISKTAALYRRLKDFGIATAVIAYPATPLDAARARFCLSASHTKEQLDYVLKVLDRLGDELEIKYSNHTGIGMNELPVEQLVY